MKVSTLLTTLCVLGVASSADPTAQCDNGPVQCCATVGLPTDSVVSPLLGLLGVVVPDMSTPVGLTFVDISDVEIDVTALGSRTRYLMHFKFIVVGKDVVFRTTLGSLA
ncbi:hypothetical protein AO1008_02352 [Aspergillus oryzae 100-8]|uniref:Hydrophobin n=1 Tax=Aspergillus oryzae (strain 3.042) TaxID=1160506 RepID=I8IDD3_ASPO3|nr:hypothetical protein Ao3042_08024 [Aspergillus oryzae 3.042]KDE76267.1 hypothetical protein AO1008_02352 [Aspergillus oryzae 100-8]|eukprot:EIT75851.1 hypothetical protein Ao3042_08024 [Aspergillus oryzae 3.042]